MYYYKYVVFILLAGRGRDQPGGGRKVHALFASLWPAKKRCIKFIKTVRVGLNLPLEHIV